MEKAGLDVQSITTELKSGSAQNGIYYIHGDYLGTGRFVTDGDGIATQFFINLPFGETMLEQMGGSYNIHISSMQKNWMMIPDCIIMTHSRNKQWSLIFIVETPLLITLILMEILEWIMFPWKRPIFLEES